jgi:uncharacterized protein with WD repeat
MRPAEHPQQEGFRHAAQQGGRGTMPPPDSRLQAGRAFRERHLPEQRGQEPQKKRTPPGKRTDKPLKTKQEQEQTNKNKQTKQTDKTRTRTRTRTREDNTSYNFQFSIFNFYLLFNLKIF